MDEAGKSGPQYDPPCEEAEAQVAEGWWGGPHPFAYEEELSWNDEEVRIDSAFRFRERQGDELRIVGNLKISRACRAEVIRTPINTPSRDSVPRTFKPSGEGVSVQGLGIAKADRADAYEQLTMLLEEELSAAAVSRDRAGRWRYGLIPISELCGPTAASRGRN